ncbi:hypothetical protein GCM10027035_21740 [Emticicia sediminis]
MKQLFTLVLFICFVSPQISAQNYDLNNFKYRFQIFKSLNTYYNYNGGRQYYYDSFDFYTHYPITSSSFERNLNGNLVYNSYKSSDTQQSSEYFYSSLDFKASQQNSDYTNYDTSMLNNTLNSNTNYNKSTTKYYKNNTFWQYNYGSRILLSNNRNSKNDTTLTKSRTIYNETDVNLNAGIGLGKGRIEDVTSAVNALFLLKDLEKEGIIKGFTNEQHENLAKGIVQLLNKRYLGDTRFIYIDQVAMLDSICKANNLSTNSNHLKYFNVLYDNLLYSPYIRTTGKRITFSLSASSTNSWKNRHSLELIKKEQFHEITPLLTIDYTNTKQINSYFQRRFSTRTGTTQYNPFSDTLLNGYKNAFIYADFDILFQPNSRTIIQAETWGRASQQLNKRENSYVNLDIRNSVSATYFISRKLRLVASVVSSLSFYVDKRKTLLNDVRKTKQYRSNFSTSLEYSIF